MNVGERFAWVRAVIAAQPRPTLAEVAVAVTLAEHFNADKGAAWPASRYIAEAIRMDRANVRRAIRELHERGFIAKVASRSRSAAFTLVAQEGVAQPPNRGFHDPLSGGSTTPFKGAARPPEQVFRSETVGIPYGAAVARSAGASRAGGGTAKNPNRRRQTTTPTTL